MVLDLGRRRFGDEFRAVIAAESARRWQSECETGAFPAETHDVPESYPSSERGETRRIAQSRARLDFTRGQSCRWICSAFAHSGVFALSTSNAIQIRGVTKTFGPKVAVSNLDLDIPSGRLIGLIGSNGAGKTTTIRMVMSILFPDTGTIEVLGRPSAIESKDRIGYLPEERGLYKKMKVAPFLEFIARLKNAETTNLSRRVMEWLARVELQDVAKKKCEELSKGMQQKVQFIAAIIHQPDLLILDEPFSGWIR